MRPYPLPEGLKFLETEKGYFALVASDFIGENSMLGLAIVEGERPYPMVKTILGSMVAHSDNPNCILQLGKHRMLWTIRDVYVHEELTINYHLYNL
jgi:hypothetical protein